MSIAIGIPTNRNFKAKTVKALLEMVTAYPRDYTFIFAMDGYNTAENRNFIVNQAKNCTHIFFTDDDMILEPDTIEKLLKHDKDIIGAAYSVRRTTGELVIGYMNDETDEWLKESKEIFECEALGGGALLVKTNVFAKVPTPHFGYHWYQSGQVRMSNDWYFCEKARNTGYKIWCDPTIRPKHIGNYEF